MPKIDAAKFNENKTGWYIEIKDLLTTGRPKKNYSKLNFDLSSNNCRHINCGNKINPRRTSGLCNIHSVHQHDLFLSLYNAHGQRVTNPRHDEIINHLVNWAKSRNFDLLPFFKDCSFTILGNIPDVTTLSLEVSHANFVPKSLENYLNTCIECVDRHFPESNNSSYQTIAIKGVNYHARILAIVFVGLLLCEESNRGDRWFWREIAKMESKTAFLGAAMPIAYFAALTFPWGMEIGKASPRFVPAAR